MIRGGLIVAESQDLVPKLLIHVGILTKFGLALAPASLGTNTGWGARAVAQPPFFKLLKAEFSASTGSYNRTNVGLLWKGSGIDYQYEWRSRDKFFGFGQNSRSEDLSAYALRGQEVRASIAWPMQPVKTGLRPGQILEDPVSEPPMPGHIQPEFAMWVGPREIVMLPGRNTPLRSIDEVFPAISSQLLDQRIEHFIYAARAGIDTRTGQAALVARRAPRRHRRALRQADRGVRVPRRHDAVRAVHALHRRGRPRLVVLARPAHVQTLRQRSSRSRPRATACSRSRTSPTWAATPGSTASSRDASTNAR